MTRHGLVVGALLAMSATASLGQAVAQAPPLPTALEGRHYGLVQRYSCLTAFDIRGRDANPDCDGAFVSPREREHARADIRIIRQDEALLIVWTAGDRSLAAFVEGTLGSTRFMPPADADSFDLRCAPVQIPSSSWQTNLQCAPPSPTGPRIAAQISLSPLHQRPTETAPAPLALHLTHYKPDPEHGFIEARHFAGPLLRSSR